MTSQASTPDARALATKNATQVLEYRHPTTRDPERSRLLHARYPLGLILLCAIATMFVPRQAGGSTPALVTSLTLLCSGCWYAIARVVADRRYRMIWRAIISATAVCSIVTVGYLGAWGRLRESLLRWEAYHEITSYLYPPFYCVAGLIVVSVTAWIDRRMSGRRQKPAGRPAR